MSLMAIVSLSALIKDGGAAPGIQSGACARRSRSNPPEVLTNRASRYYYVRIVHRGAYEARAQRSPSSAQREFGTSGPLPAQHLQRFGVETDWFDVSTGTVSAMEVS